MGPYGHYKGAHVNEDYRAGGIREEQAEVYAGKLQAEQESHHESMKEHDVGMEEPFTFSQAIDHPADRGDDGAHRAGEDRGYPLVCKFDGGVIEAPQEGQDDYGDDGLKV